MVYDDKEFIAKKIKIYRKKARLTQSELAEMVGISSKQLSRIEIAQHSPSVPTFLRIVKALDIDITEFGVQNQVSSSSVREEFIRFIYDLSETELKFCFKMIKDIIENIKTLKK